MQNETEQYSSFSKNNSLKYIFVFLSEFQELSLPLIGIESIKGMKASNFVFENKGKLKEFYRIGKLIGSGAFGDVRIWLHKESNSQRAVKILYKANMTEEDERMLINEINILRDLDHPNIVKMYEFFQDEK